MAFVDRRLLPAHRRLEGGPVHEPPLVLDALNMAAWTRRRHGTWPGSSVTPTPESQYTSIAYTERLDEIGAAPSIGTIG